MKRIIAIMLILLLAMQTLSVYAEESNKDKEEDINLVNCTEDEYKVHCYELWYDDVIFGEVKDLRDKFVRLELFVEITQAMDPIKVMSDSIMKDLIEEYSLEHTYYSAGVKREPGSMSYVGEPIFIFFGDTYGTTATQVREGDHIVIYGKIIYCARDYWSGYNQVFVLPKIIQNNGQ